MYPVPAGGRGVDKTFIKEPGASWIWVTSVVQMMRACSFMALFPLSSLKRECRPLQNECGLIGKSAESLHNANICFVQNNLFFFASRLKRLKRYADFVHVVYDLCFTCLLNKHCLVSRTDLCAMGRAAD